MGTTFYLDEEIINRINNEKMEIVVTTTGFLGKGPQLGLRVGECEIILSHEDAEKLVRSICAAGKYLNYDVE